VPIKVREVIRNIEGAGWRLVRTIGDHRVFRSPDGRITVVSSRLGDDLRPGTYRAIFRGKLVLRKTIRDSQVFVSDGEWPYRLQWLCS
jgi:predicted RNA binding protein YcfA (HicA-like mRNA interferase family)